MQTILGTSLPVFLGITVVVMGYAAFMTGQAVADTWRPAWQVFVYCALLGTASRFLIYGLFDGELLSLTGYVVDVVSLLVIGLFAFQVTKARRMVSQYPWLYERAGLFGWRRRH